VTYTAAKFARESKARPGDWVIVPESVYSFRLVYLGSG
jgi:hypothetical protein